MTTKVTKEDVERWHRESLDGTPVRTGVATDRLARLRDTAAQVPGLLRENEQLAKGRTDWDKTLGTLKERLLDAFPEADVESIGRRLRGAAPSWTLESTSALAEHVAGLAVQVPALQARVAELERERDLLTHQRDSEEARGDDEQRRGDALESEHDALQARVVELTRERNEALTTARELEQTVRDNHAKWVKARAERDALQAQVTGLERERDHLTGERDGIKAVALDLRSERDTLRAKVEAVESIASDVVTNGYGEDVEMLANRILAALSTPAAEAKQPEPVAQTGPLKHCASDSDGECTDDRCPQRVKRESYCRLARADEAAAEAEGTDR